MANIRADLVKETTFTKGAGNIITTGATVGSRPFSDVCSIGDTFSYSLRGFDLLGNPTGEFEAGIGTYVGVNTIARTTVQVSSNGGSRVFLSSLLAQIAIVLTAEDVNDLASQLPAYSGSVAGPAGASMVGTEDGSNVAQWLSTLRRDFVFADRYPTIKAAVAALPSTGGIVLMGAKNYYAGDWNYSTDYMAKPNVLLLGTRMPRLSADGKKLEGGTVIEGRFNAFAHGFGHENVGYDMGKTVCDTRYPGYDTHSANHPLGGTWDAFAFGQPPVPIGVRYGFYARNVIALCRDSSTLGHAMLMEGIDGGDVDNLVAIYGGHGIVFKSKNIRGTRVAGYAQSGQGVLFKSDTIASCEKIMLASVEGSRNPPGVTLWSAAPIPSNGGVFINPYSNALGQIQIGQVKSFGTNRGLNFDGTVGMTGADIQIGSVLCDGYTGTMDYAVIGQHATFERVQIGQVIANNANQAVYWEGADTLEIGNLRATQIANYGVMAIGNGRVRVGSVKFTTCGSAYYCDDTARIYVGTEELANVTTKWARTPPSLVAKWANYGGGNSTFDVILSNYKVELKGLIKAAAGATASMVSLPVYLRPPESRRLPGYVNNGGFVLIGIGSDATGVELNDGTAPSTGDYVSVDDIAWKY
jgi:hypothetical protein